MYVTNLRGVRMYVIHLHNRLYSYRGALEAVRQLRKRCGMHGFGFAIYPWPYAEGVVASDHTICRVGVIGYKIWRGYL